MVLPSKLEYNCMFQLTFMGFNLTRNGGLFGMVSIDWELVYNGSASNAAGSDILPMAGTATFQEGDAWKVRCLFFVLEHVVIALTACLFLFSLGFQLGPKISSNNGVLGP